MILSAQSIRRRVGLISPWHERTTYMGMTYGLSAAGYDVRIAESFVLYGGEFRLASTMEIFRMPADLLARVCDKSSWARRGLAMQNTVIEPGWQGYLTLELVNHGTAALTIAAGVPIAQIIFERLDEPTEQPYDGKYQSQGPGPQEAR